MELATFAFFTFNPDTATHQCCELATDSQAKAGAAKSSGGADISLSKRFNSPLKNSIVNRPNF